MQDYNKFKTHEQAVIKIIKIFINSTRNNFASLFCYEDLINQS